MKVGLPGQLDMWRTVLQSVVSSVESYVYQPEGRVSECEQAVALLRRKCPDLKVAWPDPVPHLKEIRARLESTGLPCSDLVLSTARFAEYFWRAEYALRYPDYYRGNLPEKSLEHFIALELLRLNSDSVFIDIASEGSPLPEIVRRMYGCRSYAQDIMYPPGISSDKIGGDACAMPVPDAMATGTALTCSLEHFEGDADTRLFRELVRVLRPGGRVIVVPLYLFIEPAIMTDPTYSAMLGIPFDSEARIYCAEGWKNRHGRFYSPESLYSRIVKPCPEIRFFVYQVIGAIEAIHPSSYVRFCLLGERR
jgi:SAM-dependent methyltransferase